MKFIQVSQRYEVLFSEFPQVNKSLETPIFNHNAAPKHVFLYNFNHNMFQKLRRRRRNMRRATAIGSQNDINIDHNV